MQKSRVRVLIVDDFQLWRDFVRSQLETVPGLEVIAQVSDGLEAVQKAKELQPDLILLDIGLRKLNGIEAARQIRQCAPTSSILFMSQERSEDIADAALATGALGYITKLDAESELLTAVDAVLHGKRFISSSLSRPFLVKPELVELSPTTRQPAFEEIVDAAMALMRSDYASMQMLYPERGTGGELRLLAFRGFNSEAARFWEWVRADSKCTCGIALHDTKRVVAPDIASSDFLADSQKQVYFQTGIRACQTTPLIGHAGTVVGMLSTHWRSSHQPSEEDLRQFDILAKQAAHLIEQWNSS